MTVTQINAGSQHNVVPAHVNLVIDVRVNDAYSNQEIALFYKRKHLVQKLLQEVYD